MELARALQLTNNKIITALSLDPEKGDGGALVFTFKDGTKLEIADDARSCCENRYMHTDDDLPYFVGATLIDMAVLYGPDIETYLEVHEVAFLHVSTSKGHFVMNTHNEHNGYYGGFMLRAAVIEMDYEPKGER